MPEYRTPGVYVEEIEIGGKPIEGVSTSTVGFLGETERGPVAPTLVTGFEHFQRVYGGYTPKSYLPYAVEGFFANGGQRCFIGRIVGANSKSARADIPADGGKITVNAEDAGVWGNRIGVKVDTASLQDDTNPLLAKLFKLWVFYWKDISPGAPLSVVDPLDRSKARDASRPDPLLREEFDNLSPDPNSPDYYVKRIKDASNFIRVEDGLAGARPTGAKAEADAKAGGDASQIIMLNGGDDGDAVGLADYEGQDDPAVGPVTGLASFCTVDEIAMICVPDETRPALKGLTDKLIDHCELLKDRFAILQASDQPEDIATLRPPTDSKYAAFYYPWIKIMDPVSGREKLVPPGGHVAGIYARSDIERGVHKAPANEVVRGAIGLQFQITKGDQDLLNPRGVNCIRTFPGRGIRVWGARTISSDPLWKYVNVRRLMIFLEKSIDEGTQWVAFEPNDQRLWARVRQTISDFLTRVWKDGALMGTTPEQAFFVKCDETTMTPDDIENGRLICLIGVAPVRPAEFVIFRIAQWRSGSAISE